MPDLCDRCADPGACCRNFWLSCEPPGTTKLEALAWIASSRPGPSELGLPFLPVERDSSTEDCPVLWHWSWSCPIVMEDGRCGDYDHRPFLCREYAAGSSKICAMFGRACPPL